MASGRTWKAAQTPGETPLQAALRIWSLFVTCHRDYDPALADLYAKGADIEQVGRIAGLDRVFLRLKFDPKQWKRLMPKLMDEAKIKGDRSLFSDWLFEEEAESVVITATRHSELLNYTVPHRVVIAKADEGEWRIVGETMNVLKRGKSA